MSWKIRHLNVPEHAQALGERFSLDKVVGGLRALGGLIEPGTAGTG